MLCGNDSNTSHFLWYNMVEKGKYPQIQDRVFPESKLPVELLVVDLDEFLTA